MQARVVDFPVVRAARRLLDNALRYDAVGHPRSTGPAYHSARQLMLGLLALFVCFSALFICLDLIDNKPTTASTGLVAAHRSVSLDWGGWFTEGVWWTGKQTPTPLPFTIHGLFFSLFGYSVRGILVLHALVGALSAWFLFRITTRRYGPWAGLLSGCLCLSMPLFLYITLAGWTFVWATMFLLLAIELTDRAALTGRGRWFVLAGLALGCAGMSRPENYAAGAIFVALAPVKIRFRIAFLLLAFAYPVTQSVLNTFVFGVEPGLRILDDARQDMSYRSLFREWFHSVRYVVLNRNYSTLFQWGILPATFCFGLPRHRLLTGVFAYFWLAFFAAYAMRRLSFNHEGYYYAHVVLSTPFLAAGLAWLTNRFRLGWESYGVTGGRASALAAVVLLLLVAYDRTSLRKTFRDHLFFRIPEPARELRDFLTAHVEPGEALVLDYFREVSWMLAELEGDQGSNIFYYNVSVTSEPRPRLNAARKDIPAEELAAMNTWVYGNLERWQSHNQARYVVLLSGEAWERETGHETALGHYPMFGLRAALRAGDRSATLGGITAHAACAGVIFANQDFLVYDLNQTGAPAPLLYETFKGWGGADALPSGWTAFPNESVIRTPLGDGGVAATLLPQPGIAIRLRQAHTPEYSEIVPGAAICIEASFNAAEPESLRVAAHFERINGESYTIYLTATETRGRWKRTQRVIVLPEDIVPGTMKVAVVLGPGARKPASVSDIAIRPVYAP